MTEEGNLIYSTKELFSKEFLNGRQFNIPEYQRGYKWTADNVATLLNDLSRFSPTENKDSFYCLQNITVAECKQGCSLNVIDGQQRLTTLFLLLSYLGELPAAGCLRYSVRHSTHEFLQTEVATRKIWAADKSEPDSKDRFYIEQACEAIGNWFELHGDETEEMRRKILKHLKVIVNQVEPDEEELVFSSLNGGKVNLDGADLLRAIMITRAARQMYDDVPDNLEKIGSFRAKLGLELDAAAMWWSKDPVKKYFNQLLPNGLAKNRQFDAAVYPIDLLYYAFYEAYKDKFAQRVRSDELDVRQFENGVDFNNVQGDDHLEFYEKVSEFNLTMHDWFEDDEIFNLTGYLMHNFKGVVNFSTLWEIWDKKVRTKPDFVKELKSLVRKRLALKFEPYEGETGEGETPEEEVAVRFDKLMDRIRAKGHDWYHDPMLYPALALADILPSEYADKKGAIRRADIRDFCRRPDEDKEHIRSETRNLQAMKEEELTPEQKQALAEENANGLNSIGNMVLLHRAINRSYRNAVINLKMDRIMGEAALAEIHIRPYTQSVFRSKIGNMERNGQFSDEMFWSDSDIERTSRSLADRIQTYLKV